MSASKQTGSVPDSPVNPETRPSAFQLLCLPELAISTTIRAVMNSRINNEVTVGRMLTHDRGGWAVQALLEWLLKNLKIVPHLFPEHDGSGVARFYLDVQVSTYTAHFSEISELPVYGSANKLWTQIYCSDDISKHDVLAHMIGAILSQLVNKIDPDDDTE